MPNDLSPVLVVRSATTRPTTFDENAMTVEAVVATTTPVARRDARGPFLEVLNMATLDLTRGKGVSVVDNHRMGSARDVVGIVEGIRVDGETAVAVLRFSTADDVAPIIARVKDGTLPGVSVGYRVTAWAEGTDPQGRRTKTTSAWAIAEISLTPNIADPNARIRSLQKESDMPDLIETVSPDDAEMTRRSEIRTLVRSAGLDALVADDLIDAGADLTRVKAEVFDATQAKRRSAPIIRSHAPANDDPAVITRRASDALAFRMKGGDLPEDARLYLNLTLKDMAVESLTRSGVSTRGMSADDIFTRATAHTTSDFTLVVSNAANKVALDTYKAAESPLKNLCRQRMLPNFKESTAVRLGETGRLEPLAENGEITHTSRAERGESMRLKTFARGLTVSRNLLIDDDLGLLGDMTAALGEAAAQTEADILVELLTGNPIMSDGVAVFHASRGNIATNAEDPSILALTDSRQIMRTRTGLDGKTIIRATPRYVLVPAEMETAAEQVLATIQPNKLDDVNPFGGKLSLLVEPRLPEDIWYVFADPARLAAMQYAYLSSAQGVQIQRTEAWDTLGLKFRAFLDFGAGWIDWRGAHRIPGA